MSDKPNAPMGAENQTSRTCSRIVGYDGDSEILCGTPATHHVIYHWAPGGDYDHGFCCGEHWRDFQKRWTCAGHHPVNGVCGMPGSRIHPDRECFFDELPEAEPARAIAVAVSAGSDGEDR